VTDFYTATRGHNLSRFPPEKGVRSGWYMECSCRERSPKRLRRSDAEHWGQRHLWALWTEARATPEGGPSVDRKGGARMERGSQHPLGPRVARSKGESSDER
jgi:hypothetical protein